MSAEVVMEKTPKGEKYIIDTARIVIVAYKYPYSFRYYAKKPYETRLRQSKARELLNEYPVTFSILRTAVGIRKYGSVG